MSRFISYLNSAEKILSSYGAAIPFAAYLKNFFSKNKKYGSGDRKSIASLCYNYFRAGHLLDKKLNTDSLLAASFLCNNQSTAIIENLKPDWIEYIKAPVQKKLILVHPGKKITELFPWLDELDESINKEAFCTSLLHQPALFTRIRPSKQSIVLKKLNQAGIAFQEKENDCLQLETGINIETVLDLDKELVVQDYNSQKVLDYLKKDNALLNKSNINVWDCCAASGGKSILVNDVLQKNIQLTVSDIRPTIIHNLKKRLANAGIKHSSFIADLTQVVKLDKKFDIIICDAPCSGSGTWNRTPEQLYFFNPEAINHFSELQKKIISHVIPHLSRDGLFFYITCSVFKKENQQVSSYIQQKFNLQKIAEQNLYGYVQMADSMFVAVFKNTSS